VFVCKGQENENRNSNAEVRIQSEASLRRLTAELDLAREFASRSGLHKTALEPPGSGR
jgi:hypothetical protein